jgi:hypothetical protein
LAPSPAKGSTASGEDRKLFSGEESFDISPQL